MTAASTPRRVLILALLVIAAVLQAGVPTYMAQPVTPGIGMSGSFYTLNGLEVPVGGTLNSSDIFVVVYSYYDKPLKVRMEVSSPPGISVSFSPDEVSFILNPGESKRLNVIIKISNNTVPDTYKIAISATALTQSERGGPVKILPSVTQEINITVTGEYSIIHAYAVDPGGNKVSTALLRLEKAFHGSTMSVADSYGELHAKVVPGNYSIKVYLAGDLVGARNITLAPYQELSLEISIKIIFIEFFSVEAVTDNNGTLISAKMILNIKNLYKTISNVSIMLEVLKDGKPYEIRELMKLGSLPEGRIQYTFDYVPRNGWTPGNYTFKIKIYGFDNKLLAESPERWLNYQVISGEKGVSVIGLLGLRDLLLILLIIIIIILLVLIQRKRIIKNKKKRK